MSLSKNRLTGGSLNDSDNPFRTMKKRSEFEFEEDSESSDYAPSPINDPDAMLKKRNTNILLPNFKQFAHESFAEKNTLFNKDILRLATEAKSTRIQDKAGKETVNLFDIDAERNTFKKVNNLRYRENVFRAATRLTSELPLYPKWVYRDIEKLEVIKFIVGGQEYQSFEDTIVNIPNSKLARCVIEHNSEPTVYFDRDSACFNYVLNFYRTGRLHAPTSACLSFFEEELEFWGINEEFMEPCCYSNYMAYKNACNTLKKFTEIKEIQKASKNTSSFSSKVKSYLHNAITVQNNGIFSRWYTFVYGMLTVSSVVLFLYQTTESGRLDLKTNLFREKLPTETLINYYANTTIRPSIIMIELYIGSYFLLDLILRLIMSPNKIVFWTDTTNWIDLLSSMSTIVTNMFYDRSCSGIDECYMIMFKIPRVLLLFKINTQLKIGTEAFVLTLRASSNELQIVFLIMVIFILVFGVLIFVAEMVSEHDTPSTFKSIPIGMWWAAVTMATVGYGDYVPTCTLGYLVGWICILFGIVIYQLPVPIFLNTFSIYYNQVQARLEHQDRILKGTVDPETLREPQNEKLNRKDLLKMKRFTISN